MLIITGSTALEFHGVNLRPKGCKKDIDALCDSAYKEHLQNLFPDKVIDIHTLPDSLMTLLNFWCTHHKGFRYLEPEAVLTLKLSHMQWDLFWGKHKRDVINLTVMGYKPDYSLYSELLKYWKQEKGYKQFLSLDKKSDEFFNDFVEYKYDHDYLHDLVASPFKPMYSRCLKEGEQVLISEEGFAKLSHQDKVKMFREEITVICLERFLLNDKYENDSLHKAWGLALKKTVTNLTKNWASDFILFNLSDFIKPEIPKMVQIINLLESDYE